MRTRRRTSRPAGCGATSSTPDSGTRVYLRLQRQAFAVPEEVRITGVVYLPRVPGDPITSRLLRELPTAHIETSINKRLFAMRSTRL